MNIVEYSEKCIKKYLEKYKIVLQIKEEFGSFIDKGVITLSTDDDPTFGIIEYEFHKKDMFIEEIRISKNKHSVSVKLLKVFLLYLFARYSNRVEYVRLIASPESYEDIRGTEQGYCLSCYYQTLGFEPIEEDIKKLSSMIDKCIDKLGINYKNKYSLCVLCDCQRQISKDEIKLAGFRISAMQIRMKRLLPSIERRLLYNSKRV